MSKKKTEATEAVLTGINPDEASEIRKETFAFPTHSRCPRCKTVDTAAYRTKKNVQYRRCLRGICRYKYVIIGTKI